MNPITRVVGVVAGLAMLGACSIASEIDTVRRMPVKGDAFQQALHAEYVKLATIEDDEGDTDNAERPAPTAAQAAMPTAGPYVVYFAFNSAKLDAKAKATINEAATAAKSAKVSIGGHTDRAGGNDYNMRLSLERANAVAAALVKAGVAKASIARSYYGEERPAVMTEDGKKEPRNRRVEITVQ